MPYRANAELLHVFYMFLQVPIPLLAPPNRAANFLQRFIAWVFFNALTFATRTTCWGLSRLLALEIENFLRLVKPNPAR
jgi:hypothetical protein